MRMLTLSFDQSHVQIKRWSASTVNTGGRKSYWERVLQQWIHMEKVQKAKHKQRKVKHTK